MWYLIPIGMQMLGGIQQGKAQEASAKAQAEQARLNALAQTTQIDRELSDIFENQMLVASMQGRSGGSVTTVMEESKRRAEVDKSLISLGAESQAKALESYGRTARNAQLMSTFGGATMTFGQVQGWWK